MSLTIQEIISEADLLVPNEVAASDKVLWLNALNQDFFNVVKVPKVISFTPSTNEEDYSLPSDVRLKNINWVIVGVIKYSELLPSSKNPLTNTFLFDDSKKMLTLRPAPYQSGLQGLVQYNRIATTTFVSSVLTASPDAPEEYHWTFIPGLAAYIALSQDDAVKASNYETQYKSAWNVAAQNYAKAVTT